MDAGEARQVEQESRRLGGKYLTFALGNEEYGIGILKVREIIGLLEVTAVPHTPTHIKGVINLRGRVIPVLDLRIKFGMPEKGYDERTCIIVAEVQGQAGTVQIGMLVDSVSEVLNIGEEEIEPPPAFGDNSATGNIMGMAKIRGTVKILLDIDRVIGGTNLEQLNDL
jgi:purine-binding chemotaxis protein CheW